MRTKECPPDSNAGQLVHLNEKKTILKGNILFIYLLNTLPDYIYNLVMAYVGLAEIDCKHISLEQQAFK